MRSVGLSDYAGVVSYITSTQGNTERLGDVQISNCQAKDIQAATAEIVATQALNTRAKSDRTCHLILSFRDTEYPSRLTLNAIEEKVCCDLGYGGHQRVSATHIDTGNIHIHIAINKIHPKRLILIDPYKSYHKLSHICERMEEQFDLQKDNHVTKKTVSECRVADIEQHSGETSLVSWVRENCLSDLENASSWSNLHKVLGDNGLEIIRRGRGLVVRSQNGTVCKASTVSRAISKQNLEKKLGPFEENQRSFTATRKYEKRPVGFAIDTSLLYQQYRNEMDQISSRKNELLRNNSLSCDAEFRAIRRRKKLLIAALKISSAPSFTKKLLYKRIYSTSAKKIATLKKKRAETRKEILQTHKRSSWVDWLKGEGEKSNEEAIRALRSRSRQSKPFGNCIMGEEREDSTPNSWPMQSVTKQGTIKYKYERSTLLDRGYCLSFVGDPSYREMERVLRVAQKRFGKTLNVKGTASFRSLAVFVAAHSQLPIKFKNHNMDMRRRELLFTYKIQGEGIESTIYSKNIPPPDARHRFRTLDQVVERSNSVLGVHHDQAESNRSGDARRSNGESSRGAWDGIRRGDRGSRTDEQKDKSNLSLNSSNGVTGRGYNVHDVSLFGMVPNHQGPEMLLQDSLHGHMGEINQSSNNDVRRSFHGKLNEQNARAAHKYINERAEKRDSGISVLPHSLLGEEKGVFVHKGIRVVDGVSLLLLERNGRVFVKPINPSFEGRTKRWTIGDEISVSDSIKKKGVRRKR